MENRDGQHNEGATSSRPATEEEGKSATARGKASVEKEVVDEEEEKQKKSMFECNICLDVVNEPVITLCGHLFCWPCIYEVRLGYIWERSQNSVEETIV